MRRLIPVIVFLLLAAACAGPTATTTTTSSPAEPTTTVGTSITIPPALQAQVEWFIGLLNGVEFDAADYENRVAASFLDQITAAQFVEVIEQVRSDASDWGNVGVVAAEANGVAVRIAPLVGEPAFILSLAIDADGKVDSLLVQPDQPLELDNPPDTIEEAADRLAGLGTVGLVVADISGGECVPQAGRDPDVAAPIASMFKFYVLGAVVDAVAAGRVSWDQEVAIADQYRSLPSGIVQSDPPGSVRTVRELAELMISISDNTATDHLLFLVGRDAVEQAQEDYGHSDPARNLPFLSTFELFVLKLADRQDSGDGPGVQGIDYVAADEAERRAILEDEVPLYTVDDLDLTIWVDPIAVDQLEWFASPLDLCRALVRLHQDPEASRILAINPGIPDQTGRWSYIGFKGGSEPGVLGLAWYLETPGGDATVVAGTVWNPNAAFNGTEAVLLLGAIRDLAD